MLKWPTWRPMKICKRAIHYCMFSVFPTTSWIKIWGWWKKMMLIGEDDAGGRRWCWWKKTMLVDQDYVAGSRKTMIVEKTGFWQFSKISSSKCGVISALIWHRLGIIFGPFQWQTYPSESKHAHERDFTMSSGLSIPLSRKLKNKSSYHSGYGWKYGLLLLYKHVYDHVDHHIFLYFVAFPLGCWSRTCSDEGGEAISRRSRSFSLELFPGSADAEESDLPRRAIWRQILCRWWTKSVHFYRITASSCQKIKQQIRKMINNHSRSL